MIAIIGHILLWAAFLCQSVLLLAPARYLRLLSITVMLCLAGAFAALVTVFTQSDFSVRLVYAHSHSLKPLLFKMTAAWGNHEGSLLMACFFLSLFAWPLLKGACRDERLHRGACRVIAGSGCLFTAYMLWTSNPFIRFSENIPPEGQGFNPLLQDVGLAIHPPTLYMGYLGLVLPFALVLSGLRHQLLSRKWAEQIRVSAVFAWGWLTAGILLGSHWAYRELGWGGFWFWDPVENASFMPWLAATALVHSAIISRNRDACYAWTCALGCLSFFLVPVGFFLVRSGVITSVHSFASAPERGIFIIVAMLLCAAVSVFALMYYPLAPSSGRMPKPVRIISRGGAMLLQNILMVAALATVMLGTCYPLILEAFTGDKVTVGAPYYNAIFMYFAVALFLLAALAAPLSWGEKGGVRAVLHTSAFLPFVTAACAGYAVVFFGMPDTPPAFLLLFPLAAAGFAAEIFGLYGDIRGNSIARVSLPRVMMRAAHGGMWIAVSGIIIAGFLSQETEAVMHPGDTVSVAGYNAVFDRMERVRGANYLSLQTVFTLYDGAELLGYAAPESRFYPVEQTQTAEAALYMLSGAHLYISVGEALPSGEAGIRFMYRPGVPLLWIGGILLVLAGAGAALTRVRYASGKA